MSREIQLLLEAFDKAFAICLSQALVCCSLSQATSDVFSWSGSSVIACLMTSSVLFKSYLFQRSRFEFFYLDDSQDLRATLCTSRSSQPRGG